MEIEGCTAFVDNNLGEGINNFCKRSEHDEVERFVVCRTHSRHLSHIVQAKR